MAEIDIKKAIADIASTSDLLERALKLAGLITTLFQRHGIPLVVVGGSAVEFYTEGGYMSGDIDFCRKSLDAIPPSSELLTTARKMMVAAVGDPDFNWNEAERLAALPSFGVLEELRRLHVEVCNG